MQISIITGTKVEVITIVQYLLIPKYTDVREVEMSMMLESVVKHAIFSPFSNQNWDWQICH